MNRILTFCLLFLLSQNAIAQKQLLLMKGEKVLLRLYPGDEIIFKLKGGKQKRTSYVNNLSDTAVVIHRDTIPFRKIERLYFDQTALHNRLGLNLMVAGVTLFLIDQINHTVVQKNEPSLDDWTSRASLTAIGIGLPLWLARKKSQKINYKYRLFMARETSPFYRPDIRGSSDY